MYESSKAFFEADAEVVGGSVKDADTCILRVKEILRFIILRILWRLHHCLIN